MSAATGVYMLAAVGILLVVTGLPAWVVLIGVAMAFAAPGLATGTFTLSLMAAIPARITGLLENDLLQALPLYVLMGALLHHLPLEVRRRLEQLMLQGDESDPDDSAARDAPPIR